MGVISAKSKILHAAACVVERAGAAHLTLDAVAEESQLSKGGLLYHFPSKRALLSGMLEHLLDRLQTRAHEAQLASEASTVGALIQAQQTQDDDERAMGRALIAAAAEDPSLLEPARQVLTDWIATVSKESHYGVLLLLAVEGLRFMEMLNLLDLAASERASLYRQMAELAEEVAV